MARATRDNRLENPSNRLKQPAGEYIFTTIGSGLSLGYRRPASGGAGTWYSRIILDGKQKREAIGEADDFQDVEKNPKLYTYSQAQEVCRDRMDDALQPEHKKMAPLTVDQAAENYLEWYSAHKKDVSGARGHIKEHILPTFSGRMVQDLSNAELKKWRDSLISKPPRVRRKKGETAIRYREEWSPTPEEVRARKATANRILTTLKALLNKSFKDRLVADDVEWRSLEPFGNVDRPIEKFLTADECQRIMNAAGSDFRRIVQAAALAGMRYGEICNLRVRDFISHDRGVWCRITKSGKPRFVPLNGDGMALLEQQSAGKPGDDYLFVRADGLPWGKSHQDRRMKAACEAARVEPVSFHILRHSYASLIINSGVTELSIVGDLLGHADGRITKRHYAHIADATKRAAVENLPSFEIKASNVTALKVTGG